MLKNKKNDSYFYEKFTKKIICSIPKLVSNLIRSITHETNVVGRGNCPFLYMPNIISMYSIFQEKKKIILLIFL